MGERVFDKDTTEISSRLGEAFIIELEGHPSAGYEWRLDFEGEGVDFEELDISSSSGGIGSTGNQRFRVTPRRQGRCTIFLEYGRPWETEPAERRPVILHVEEGSGS